MKRFRSASLLAAVALALALPSWAVGPSEQSKHDGTTVADRANQASSSSDASTSAQGDVGGASKAQGKAAAAKKKPHGPTAVMDRATPTEKSNNADPGAKHPPTGRMDRSTPDQKSPASTSTDDAK